MHINVHVFQNLGYNCDGQRQNATVAKELSTEALQGTAQSAQTTPRSL